jgi:hypothetical protein
MNEDKKAKGVNAASGILPLTVEGTGFVSKRRAYDEKAKPTIRFPCKPQRRFLTTTKSCRTTIVKHSPTFPQS